MKTYLIVYCIGSPKIHATFTYKIVAANFSEMEIQFIQARGEDAQIINITVL